MPITPISIIIDDSTPLVHVYREHHGGNRCNQLGEPLKDKVPLDFMYEFCGLARDAGLRGKFSIIPMPGCLGDIVHGLRGFDRAEVELWLDAARTRLAPAFDFCPEILTHHNAIDLATGELLPENEEQWSFKQNRSTLGPYIARALELLRQAGIIATGVTSPWWFGIEVENHYAAAISDAFFSVLGKKNCWYFLHNRTGEKNVRPVVSFSEGDRRVVSVSSTFHDGFWGSIDSDRTDEEWINGMADYYLTADGSSGAVLDALALGSQPVLITHWQSLFSNGRRTGLRALRVVAERINKYLSDRVVWTNFTDLMNQTLQKTKDGSAS